MVIGLLAFCLMWRSLTQRGRLLAQCFAALIVQMWLLGRLAEIKQVLAQVKLLWKNGSKYAGQLLPRASKR